MISQDKINELNNEINTKNNKKRQSSQKLWGLTFVLSWLWFFYWFYWSIEKSFWKPLLWNDPFGTWGFAGAFFQFAGGWLGDMVMSLPILIGGLVFFFVWISAMSSGRPNKLLRTGELIKTSFLQVEKQNIRINKRPTYKILSAYEDQISGEIIIYKSD